MIKFIIGFFAVIVVIGVLTACHKTDTKQKPLTTVKKVDLARYAGTWYEIARLPASFEEGCSCVTATYLQQKDHITVLNRCLRGNPPKETLAKGKAWPVKDSNNSKLKVQFFWPFKGNYWIIYLDKDYRYAIVGEPKRKYLWFLSRTPSITPSKMRQLKNIAIDKQYNNLDSLIITEQNRC
jgi:apolipoprotein D and lipocalin family protein